MKNIFKLSIALLICSINCLSQNEIFLKVSYNPETRYTTVSEQTKENIITYSGSVKSPASSDLNNPTKIKNITAGKSICITGSPNIENTIPLTMEYFSVGEKNAIPEGTLIYGKVKPEKTPELDSIVYPNMDENMKKIILGTINTTFPVFEISQKKLKIGESFSLTTPFSIPMGQKVIEMDIITTYKLISIEKGIATLDMAKIYNVKSNFDEVKSTLKEKVQDK